MPVVLWLAVKRKVLTHSPSFLTTTNLAESTRHLRGCLQVLVLPDRQWFSVFGSRLPHHLQASAGLT